MNKYDFNTLSDDALEKLILEAYQERDRRANARKEKLIDAFRKAFNNIKEAGLDISCKDSFVSDFDQFDFY